MKKSAFLIVLAFVLFSCKKETKENQLKTIDWLLGSWENKSENGTMQENWGKINDSLYKGASYFIKEKDTLHKETIGLLQKGDQILYIPTVKGQNNDQPVVFLLTKKTAQQVVFENPNHDYPKKIVYTLITKDSLVATISGTQQGKSSSDSFPMKKKN
jgi:Domain of unknown function (DUF6265)